MFLPGIYAITAWTIVDLRSAKQQGMGAYNDAFPLIGMSLQKTILILLICAALSVVIGLSVKPASGKEDRFRIFVIITGALTAGLLTFPFM